MGGNVQMIEKFVEIAAPGTSLREYCGDAAAISLMAMIRNNGLRALKRFAIIHNSCLAA